MIDWTQSMQQTFEFYTVDPDSWLDLSRITTITSCSITRDSEADTLESASFDVVDLIGECYVRVYLVAIQNGETEKFPLGTFLVQTPSSTFDGKTRNVSADAYSPLIELKEKSPAIGYYVSKGEDVMDVAYSLTKDNLRAEVARPITPSTALAYDLVADPSDTWLEYIRDLLTAAYASTCYIVEYNEETNEYERLSETVEINDGYREVPGAKTYTITYIIKVLADGSEEEVEIKNYTNDKVYKINGEDRYFCKIANTNKYKFELDEMGRVLFSPDQETSSLQPVWTYTDDNCSILQPSISMDHDLYNLPNVIEVLCSADKAVYYAKVVNDDPESPVSIATRGREIVYRETNPEIYGTPTQERVNEYAQRLLDSLSNIEYSVTYTHGYCPVRVGDCVRINYKRAGLENVKAKVVSQTIDCATGCQVTEKAVFTTKLWR